MSAPIAAGLRDRVFDAQRVFRAVLAALAEPGRPVPIAVEVPELPAGLPGVLAAVALTLADHDTPLWLSPSVAALAPYVRFHTGAPSRTDPRTATFALVGPGELPPLRTFFAGTAVAPETSATVIAAVDDFTTGVPATLSGPGIEHPRPFAPGGFTCATWADVAANNDRFPAGVDLLLCSGTSIAGIPRSTCIRLTGER